VITRADLEKTGQSQTDLPAVLRDIIENITVFSTVALLAESNGGVYLLIAGLPHIKIGDLARQLAPTASSPLPLQGIYEYIALTIPNTTVAEIEQKLLTITKV
jgi:hypothetical protein